MVGVRWCSIWSNLEWRSIRGTALASLPSTSLALRDTLRHLTTPSSSHLACLCCCPTLDCAISPPARRSRERKYRRCDLPLPIVLISSPLPGPTEHTSHHRLHPWPSPTGGVSPGPRHGLVVHQRRGICMITTFTPFFTSPASFLSTDWSYESALGLPKRTRDRGLVSDQPRPVIRVHSSVPFPNRSGTTTTPPPDLLLR
jgi:hypothetical protein